jgi:hypothetical protein
MNRPMKNSTWSDAFVDFGLHGSCFLAQTYEQRTDLEMAVHSRVNYSRFVLEVDLGNALR